ncbi:flavin-containing monooxygenase [Halostreptopolyspora alba]|uniref:NAD(P)/FAD-dependent oxidoreductase n=1 Tax=Halostreptopolyspora alba TaxID=2487137 RepID=A0A3N0E3N4_9ACTN|nr:NAD(P)/FAD-dependent oxidoreductase [Nocardiopsaceae bacterium YIM 96095]
MSENPLVIIGAGQAGLATARTALRRGVRPVVLESAGEPGGSWPHYYDSLTLFSPSRFAALPGMALPGAGDRYPGRDEVVEYLRRYAARLDADIRVNHRVKRLEPGNGALTAVTDDGERLDARAVVVATGGFGRPHIPTLAGMGGFFGHVLHAAEYRSPEPFAGQRVVIVGGGNSAVQIGVELASVADVTLATRRPISWMPQRPLGRDMHWWFTRTGLDSAPLGSLWHRLPPSVLDDGHQREAVEAGRPDRRPLFTRVTADGVEWSDGTREPVDTLLLATGYRPAVDFLEGTPALDDDGAPRHRNGVSTTVPGLGYVGLEFQRSFSSATLRGVGRDARHVLGRLGLR